MEKKASNQGLQQSLSDSIQKFADFSVSTLKTSVENVTRNVTTLNKVAGDIGLGHFSLPFMKMSDADSCCAPKQECPPHCIMELIRHAAPGEKITGGKPAGRGEWLALRFALSTYAGVHQDHGRGRGSHHSDHHHRPHQEHIGELERSPRLVGWQHDSDPGRDHAEFSHVQPPMSMSLASQST